MRAARAYHDASYLTREPSNVSDLPPEDPPIPPTEDDNHNVVEFISREEYEQNLQGIEQEAPTGGVSQMLTRQSVSRNILGAFEMAGGVQRLADILNGDEDKFYHFAVGPYARLAPSALADTHQGNQTTIKHVIPRGALDE